MAGKMASDQLRKLASETISKSEGHRSNVYNDIKDVPSIGKGLNLQSPLTRTVLQGFGYNPDEVISGKVTVPEETLNDVYEYLLDKNLADIQDKFSDQGLSEHELAALTSLNYNSPSLIGPNLTKAIMNGDKSAAAKEILLRSNKEKNSGIAKRRLKEASLFAGGKLPDLTPEETMELRSHFVNMPDSAEKRKLYTDYPMLNPEQIKTGYPFFKIKKNLYSPMKEEYEASNGTPEIAVPPIENLGNTFVSPNDSMEPIQGNTEEDILNKYNLLNKPLARR
jgi:GH24 family phage-related lysozyme (muramidase)